MEVNYALKKLNVKNPVYTKKLEWLEMELITKAVIDLFASVNSEVIRRLKFIQKALR